MPEEELEVGEVLEWSIYHANADFASKNGDPKLGTVMATTKEKAEKAAAEGRWQTNENISAPTGYWAWRDA